MAESDSSAPGMTEDKATLLRKPFPEESVGILPKPYKKDSPKGECKECGGYHGLPAVHLDYVGHANVTDRLLSVDPEWSWEPFAVDDRGLPQYDNAGGLWIRLTVCGMTRLGYGDGPDPKQRIGDALRNAAMRFGVALDLWTKDELESAATASDQKAADKPPAAPTSITDDQRKYMMMLFGDLGFTDDDRGRRLDVIAKLVERTVASSSELTEKEAARVIRALEMKRKENKDQATHEKLVDESMDNLTASAGHQQPKQGERVTPLPEGEVDHEALLDWVDVLLSATGKIEVFSEIKGARTLTNKDFTDDNYKQLDQILQKISSGERTIPGAWAKSSKNK